MTGRLRVGFVGAGWWATANHLPILRGRSDVELAAVCRLGQAELDRVRETFGFAYATEDYDAMLREAALDAVFVCSPHKLHAGQAIAAAQRGLHLLIEKPMATSAGEARAVERAVDAAGVEALVPFGWNFQPFAAVAREWVEGGRIGAVRHISATMASPLAELLSGGDMPGTEDLMFRPDARTWSDVEAGGYGWGQLVHLLGLLAHVTGLSARTVFAFTDAGVGRCDLFNAVAIRGERGETVSVSGAATLPTGAKFQIDIRIFGEDGVVLLDVERERLELRRRDGEKESFGFAPEGGAYQCVEPVNFFIDLCRGRSALNPGSVRNARVGCEIVEAMNLSARTGAPVAIKDL